MRGEVRAWGSGDPACVPAARLTPGRGFGAGSLDGWFGVRRRGKGGRADVCA